MSPSSASRSMNAVAPTSKNERVKKRSLEGDDVKRQKDEKRQKEDSPSRLFSAVATSNVSDSQIEVASHQESSLQNRINSWLEDPLFFSRNDLGEEFIKIITDSNAKGLLTKEHLSSTVKDGPDKGVNAVWILAANNQWEILKSLNDKNLLTQKLLASKPQDGPHKGINVVWILAHYQQWEILISLKDKNLLTQDLLASKPQDGPHKGVNVVWILANHEQWDTLKNLNDKNLLTQEILASTLQNGSSKGQNVVWILAHYQQSDILKSLNDKNLLSSIHFETKFGNQNALEKLFRVAIEAKYLNPSKLDFINKLLLKIEEVDEYTLLTLNRYLKLVLKKEKNTPITEQVDYSDSEKFFLITLRKKVPVWIKAPQPERNIFCALFPPGKEEYPAAYSIVTSYQLTEEALSPPQSP